MRVSSIRVRGVSVCVFAALALAQSGCGAIFLGSTQLVTVHAIPPSATVRVLQTGLASQTPALVPLSRDGSYVLVVEAPGYRPVSVPLYRSLHIGVVVADIFLTGLIGV